MKNTLLKLIFYSLIAINIVYFAINLPFMDKYKTSPLLLERNRKELFYNYDSDEIFPQLIDYQKAKGSCINLGIYSLKNAYNLVMRLRSYRIRSYIVNLSNKAIYDYNMDYSVIIGGAEQIKFFQENIGVILNNLRIDYPNMQYIRLKGEYCA